MAVNHKYPPKKLTDKLIAALEYHGKTNERQMHWDSSLPGFGVRVNASGSKSFVISYRMAGKKFLSRIGKFGKMPLATAKHRARTYFKALRQGADGFGAAHLGYLEWCRYFDNKAELSEGQKHQIARMKRMALETKNRVARLEHTYRSS